MCVSLVCSYVWEHLEMGYVQGMCDLLAPLMVILDDGEKAHDIFHHQLEQNENCLELFLLNRLLVGSASVSD